MLKNQRHRRLLPVVACVLYDSIAVIAFLCVRSFSIRTSFFSETYIRCFTILVVNTITLKKGESAIVQAVAGM
jgi:hypothetical protein